MSHPFYGQMWLWRWQLQQFLFQNITSTRSYRAAPKSDQMVLIPMSHPFYGQMWFWRWQLQQLLFRILCLPDHTGKHRSRVIRGEGGKGAQDPKGINPRMSHPFYGKMWLWRWQLQQFLFRILRLPDHTGQHRSRIQMVLIPVCRIHSTGKCGSGGGSCSSSFSEYYVYPIIQGSTEVESLEGKVGKGLKIQKVLIPVCRIHSTGKCGFGGGSCSSSFSEYYVYPIIQGSTEVGSKWY
ncbi:hypothetical protein CDAR_540131 [Caerostris darwini]|uniref:Uncharacterized protein n=1 Tax=Caerostris darwini TaxID=1538125 RepID=A0AAV4WT53_9ARAC|nr:hypothetical protein CDAR_540131 [Caerostris darwini]